MAPLEPFNPPFWPPPKKKKKLKLISDLVVSKCSSLDKYWVLFDALFSSSLSCYCIHLQNVTLILELIQNKCLKRSLGPKFWIAKNLNEIGKRNNKIVCNNAKKSFNIWSDKKFTRRIELEKENFHLLIVDIHSTVNIRMINIYRLFRPPGLISPNAFYNSTCLVPVIAGLLLNN